MMNCDSLNLASLHLRAACRKLEHVQEAAQKRGRDGRKYI